MISLFDAIESRDPAALRQCLAAGVDPNAPDPDGACPLELAVESGSAEAVDLLLEHGADPDGIEPNKCNPLLIALLQDEMEAVRLLLQAGATTRNARWGDTPLTIAAGHGALEIVQLLLDRGEDPNVRNDEGEIPLTFAIVWNHPRVVELLLERGADVNLPVYDDTPLMHAVDHHACNSEIVKMLLARGANVNWIGAYGRTALTCALENRDEDTALLLIDAGACADIGVGRGGTALELAMAGELHRAAAAIRERLT